MQRFHLALCSLLMLTAPAFAGDCYLYSDLAEPDAAPQLYTVSGASKVHFIANTSDGAGCPGTQGGCSNRAYLVAGDTVIVTGSEGDYLCATYVANTAPNDATTGWLPALSLVSKAAPATDWTGTWHYTDEHEIVITAAGKDSITVSGTASWGTHDPQRVANGGVNTGEFTATIQTDRDTASFSIGDEGNAVAYDSSPDTYSCGMRLWQRSQYLIAADNLNCGGNNVSFTGVYAKSP